MTAINFQLLKKTLADKVDKNLLDQNNLNLRSLFNKASDELNGNSFQMFDAVMASNPNMARAFNQRTAKDGIKKEVDYSVFEEANARAVTETNTPCVFVSCVDILMEYYYCDTGIHNYMRQIATDGCAVKIPVIPDELGSTPLIPLGASIQQATLAVTKCIEVKPEKYGEYVTLDLRDITCNTCVDNMVIILKRLARRMFRMRENTAMAKVLATATNVTTGANITTTIQDLSDAIKSNITTAGALTYFTSPVGFDNIIRNYQDASGRRAIEATSVNCEGKCRTICLDGNKFVEIDTIPVVANVTNLIAGYMEYSAVVSSPVQVQECADCLDKMNNVLKVGNVAYYDVFIPTQFNLAFAKTTIAV